MSFFKLLLKDDKMSSKTGIPSLDLSYLGNDSEDLIQRNKQDDTKKRFLSMPCSFFLTFCFE